MSTLDRCACECGKLACASVRGRQHGTPSCYRDGCRCDDCVTCANTEANKRHRRSNEATRAVASKAGQQWTTPEMEMTLRTDLTVREIALKIGRSIKAVEQMRWLCRHDLKYVNAVGDTRETA